MSEELGSIRVLDAAVAQKIAAGEVIERPAGVVRELIDNALDAGATRVELSIESGGIDRITLVDNGSGMTPIDIKRCVLPHATSKISRAEDLEAVTTLGFRGEALSSVAAVSEVSITSARAEGTAHRLTMDAGREVSFGPAPGAMGTRIEVARLFYNMPARKQFLKRAASESSLVRTTFLDKALPFPEVEFKFFSNGELKSFLAPGDHITRISDAYPERTEPSLLQELAGSGDGFSFCVIAGEPKAHRTDRKQLQIFVNRRRVWEYALIQAVEYAYRDYLHGGLYPTAYLFLEIEPRLVDFNIHPAKREVRFRNLADIHKRIVGTLKTFLTAFDHRRLQVGQQALFTTEAATRSSATGSGGRPVTSHASAQTVYDLTRRFEPGSKAPTPLPPGAPQAVEPDSAVSPGRIAAERAQAFGAGHKTSTPFRYLGQIMNLFLVVEIDETLYLVDQHAAHERIIYDRLRSGSGGQELLFPIQIEVPPEKEALLNEHQHTLRRLGIEVEKEGSRYELATVPATLSLAAEDLAALLMDLLEAPDDFERKLFASLSCRSAVMDGDPLSADVAIEIVSGVIGLENARCPHGRPVWVAFQKEQLADMVGRT
ncbi:MAG: DNA mismatch repair endonuclease MutL [Spirochaetales bacterium]